MLACNLDHQFIDLLRRFRPVHDGAGGYGLFLPLFQQKIHLLKAEIPDARSGLADLFEIIQLKDGAGARDHELAFGIAQRLLYLRIGELAAGGLFELIR